MKKLPKKLAAAATLFAATMNLNGCVYGPPPEEFDEPMSGNMGEHWEEYAPEVNINQNVYGPPPDMSTAEDKNDTNGDNTNE